MKFLPKKKINISEVEWEKERERRRIAAEKAALGLNTPEPEEENDGMVNGEYEVLERDIFPERIVCPDCGNITFEGVERCNRCGKEL